MKVKVAQSCPTLCIPLDYTVHPGQNTGVSSLSLLQGIFLTRGLNPGLSHCRRILYQLSHQGSPKLGDKLSRKTTVPLGCLGCLACLDAFKGPKVQTWWDRFLQLAKINTCVCHQQEREPLFQIHSRLTGME